MDKKFLQAKLVKSGNKIQFIATDETVDRQSESIPIDTWDLNNFKRNPVLLVNHDYRVESIVGLATGLSFVNKQLVFEPTFHEITQLSREVKEMVEGDILNTVSVGFMSRYPKRGQDGKAVNELLEISFVPVPANPSASRIGKALENGINDEEKERLESFVKSLDDLKEEKGSIQDEINIEEAYKMKWEKFSEVNDVISAFWSVYFREDVPVEEFTTLLGETITLLQKVQNGEDVSPGDNTVSASIGEVSNNSYNAEIVKQAGEATKTDIKTGENGKQQTPTAPAVTIVKGRKSKKNNAYNLTTILLKSIVKEINYTLHKINQDNN